MQLTKEQLIDAHEQGLVLTYSSHKFKIVSILNDIYAINYLDSRKVMWWLYESFEDCTIEQPKQKYNGRAVKCDTVEQCNFVIKHLGKNYKLLANNCINIQSGEHANENYYIDKNYEIISFSQYCEENGIKEPILIQGFEVKDGYNEIVSCSNDNVNFRIDILKIVYSDNCQFPFTCVNGSYRYVRYPHKEEINEIKFSN